MTRSTEWWHRVQSAAWLFAEWWIERQMHRPSKLVCPTVATALGGTTTSGLTEISTSACQLSTVMLPTLPTATSLISTGELTPALRIRDLDVVGGGVGSPSTAPGSGRKVNPLNEQPVSVSTTHDPTMATPSCES